MDISIVGIFTAGILTFFTPCVLPLIPMYISALVGTNVLGIKHINRGQLLIKSVSFSMGFTAVFSVLGFTASAVGSFQDNKVIVLLLAAVIIMAFGLKFLNVMEIPFVDRVLRADASKAAAKASVLGAFLMGVIFAAGWSPCAGPVLGSVLTYTASKTYDVVKGGLYLAAYGFGLAVPLILTAVFAETGMRYIQRANRFVLVFEKAIGIFLVLLASTLLFQVASLTLQDVRADHTIMVAANEKQSIKVNRSPVMIEFHSEDCEVCEEMKPVINELKEECSKSAIDIRQIDIFAEDGEHWAEKYRVVAVPTFVFLDADGLEEARLIGYQKKTNLLRSIADVSGKTCSNV
jgi:cytochrome c-type biogenesis protein